MIFALQRRMQFCVETLSRHVNVTQYSFRKPNFPGTQSIFKTGSKLHKFRPLGRLANFEQSESPMPDDKVI